MQTPEPQSPVTFGEDVAPQLEIAHVLFMDIVGFSLLKMQAQAKVQMELQRTVQNSEVVRQARTDDRLIVRSTGDGMALLFLKDMLSPIRCALEIDETLKVEARAIRQRTGGSPIVLRMGIHTGPVWMVADMNAQNDVAGDGIIIAQRVMDCGDEGHILLSDEFARYLGKVDPWPRYLNDLGICWVKHGVPIHLFNLYGRRHGQRGPHTFGNGNRPKRMVRNAVMGGDGTGNGRFASVRTRLKAAIVPTLIAAALMGIGYGLWRVPGATYKALGKQVSSLFTPKKPKPKPKVPKKKPVRGGNRTPTYTSTDTGNTGRRRGSASVSSNGDSGGRTAAEPQTVPDLTGLPLEDARTVARGLVLKRSPKSDYSTEYTEGTIYQQEPPAGRPCRPGSAIYVRVSKGEPPVKDEEGSGSGTDGQGGSSGGGTDTNGA